MVILKTARNSILGLLLMGGIWHIVSMPRMPTRSSSRSGIVSEMRQELAAVKVELEAAAKRKKQLVRELNRLKAHSEKQRSSVSSPYPSIDPNTRSCAVPGIGHVGDQFGSPSTPIHWVGVLSHLDQTPECLQQRCETTVSWCCFSRFMRVFVWYVDALRRHGIEHVLSHGSLVAALRNGGMPPCHYDAEIHVFLRSEEDEEIMGRITAEGVATEFVITEQWGNWLFKDDYVRVDTYGFRPNVSDDGTLVWFAYMDYKKDHSYTVPDELVFPTSTCNFYGIDMPCPAQPAGFLDNIYKTKPGEEHRWYLPTYVFVKEHVPENKKLAHKCENAALLEGLGQLELFNKLRRDRVPYLAESLLCLYDHGYPSLLDTWDVLDQERRLDIVAQGYELLPVSLNGTLGERNRRRFAAREEMHAAPTLPVYIKKSKPCAGKWC